MITDEFDAHAATDGSVSNELRNGMGPAFAFPLVERLEGVYAKSFARHGAPYAQKDIGGVELAFLLSNQCPYGRGKVHSLSGRHVLHRDRSQKGVTSKVADARNAENATGKGGE